MKSKRKFAVGSRVMQLKDPLGRVGEIKHIGIDEIIIYLGRNEWETEYSSFATVKYDTGIENVKLDDLILEQQVRLYDELCLGDLIFYGKLKKRRAVVIEIKPRKGRCISKKCVTILEGGVKRVLSLRNDISHVQRATTG